MVIEDDFLKVKVTAQPIDNKANKALVEFLAKQFKIPKSYIEIIKGNTSKEKTILISNINETQRSFVIFQLTK